MWFVVLAGGVVAGLPAGMVAGGAARGVRRISGTGTVGVGAMTALQAIGDPGRPSQERATNYSDYGAWRAEVAP